MAGCVSRSGAHPETLNPEHDLLQEGGEESGRRGGVQEWGEPAAHGKLNPKP